MTEDLSAARRCNGCGTAIVKAHRIEGERCFCSTCYQREFKRRACPECGTVSRLPKNDLAAICRPCTKKLPCARCAKPEYKLGKFTQYGPVCNSCSRYFRKAQTVEGHPSPPQLDVSAVQHVSDHGTCGDCRRHRRLLRSPTGRRLCSLCLNVGQVPCPSCAIVMPAGRGNACDTCYWKMTFAKRLELDEAGLSSPGFAALFRSFGKWLINEVPPQKAALTIHGYLPFFCDMEARWPTVPSYPELVRHFTAEGLRRVRLPMRWLAETGQVHVSDEEREDASDERRIDAMFATIPSGTLASTALAAYRAELLERALLGRTSVRSMRLALRPAQSLLQSTDVQGLVLPDQGAIDRYLLEAPGQKAAVTGFVSFLNRRYGMTLVARSDPQKQRSVRQRKLEVELASLIASKARDQVFEVRWVAVSLQFFHGLPGSVARRLAGGTVVADQHGYAVEWNGATYWIPRWDHRPGDTGANAVTS